MEAIIRKPNGQFEKGSKPICGFKKGIGTRTGIEVSIETREKLRIANTGKKRSKEAREKISKALKGIRRGHQSEEHKKKLSDIKKIAFADSRNHPQWKGNKAGYRAIHQWIVRKYGNPMKCEDCQKIETSNRKIHWSNTDHKYKRDIIFWKRLCSKCHAKLNKQLKKQKNES